MASFSVEAVVRGYHVYKDIWTAVIDGEFPCKREDGNKVDPFAVAVRRGDDVIARTCQKFNVIKISNVLNFRSFNFRI